KTTACMSGKSAWKCPLENPLSRPLLHAVTPGLADVQDIDGRGVFLDLVDDPVDIRLLAIQQMPRGVVFGSDRSAARVRFKAEDGLFHPLKPPRRLRRSFRFDTPVDEGEIALGASRDLNPVGHAHVGRRTESPVPGGYGLWPCPHDLAGY